MEEVSDRRVHGGVASRHGRRGSGSVVAGTDVWLWAGPGCKRGCPNIDERKRCAHRGDGTPEHGWRFRECSWLATVRRSRRSRHPAGPPWGEAGARSKDELKSGHVLPTDCHVNHGLICPSFDKLGASGGSI